MAQVFPLNVDDLSADEARVSLAGTLAALPDPWTLLRHRRIGGDQAEPIDVVLVHPEIGVALVDEAPRDPAPSARRLREYLDGQRFGEFFPGELPIVALNVAADEFEMLGERLAAAFEAAPRLSVADADWADAVIELLMVPDDLAMAPVGDTEAPRMPDHAATRGERFDGPEGARFNEAPDERSDEMSDEPVLHRERFDTTRRERFDELSSEPVRRERFDDAPRDRYSREPSLGGAEPPLPLMVDWPFASSYQRRRRRGRIAALAVIILLLAGAGVAAWEYAGDDLTVASNDVTPRAQDNASQSQDNASRSIEVPLPSQSTGAQSAQTAANPAPSAPPPVPAAPPVVMAQKPYAAPPPSPPKATPVAPLPQVAEAKPPSPPPAAATPPSAAPAQTAKADDSGKAKPSAPPQTEPEKTQTASALPPPPAEKPATETAEAPTPRPAKPTAAPSPAKPKATRTAKAELPRPPRRAEPARHAPSAVSRPHPSEPSDNPPIDATDLPPLDEAPAPQRPTQLATPNGSSQPPVNGLGPPVPLWRSQQASNNLPPPQTATAATPASADAGNRECRPYTSSTTLTGRGLRVEGIACRGNDGQWRLVSEVPLR
ncbi:MAG TPA: hypothetical protein VN681_12005 [Stellaceae bacterium]|nr:hypothetical protein [Stellaceae bacterium]